MTYQEEKFFTSKYDTIKKCFKCNKELDITKACYDCKVHIKLYSNCILYGFKVGRYYVYNYDSEKYNDHSIVRLFEGKDYKNQFCFNFLIPQGITERKLEKMLVLV